MRHTRRLVESGTSRLFFAPTQCVTCPAGHYSLEGTAIPLPCAAGYFSNATNVANPSDCVVCPPGAFCVAASTHPTNCSAGSYAQNVSNSLCSTCDEGSFQDATGATHCKICPPGNLCPPPPPQMSRSGWCRRRRLTRKVCHDPPEICACASRVGDFRIYLTEI